MPISISMIALSSQLVIAVADKLPSFDMDRTCRLDLAATSGLTNTQSMKACLMDENRAKRLLGTEWPSYAPSAKSSCISQESIGGTPSYVSLRTCLQMDIWAKQK
jgi:hypothetical protein